MEEMRTFDAGFLTFSFRDAEGEVIASFRVNPTDAGLLSRAEEAAEFFRAAPWEGLGTYEVNGLIEEKIVYLLGYDAREELFGRVSATTVSPDGELFAAAVLDAVAEAVAPEIRRREEALRARTAKYTAKYGEA